MDQNFTWSLYVDPLNLPKCYYTYQEVTLLIGKSTLTSLPLLFNLDNEWHTHKWNHSEDILHFFSVPGCAQRQTDGLLSSIWLSADAVHTYRHIPLISAEFHYDFTIIFSKFFLCFVHSRKEGSFFLLDVGLTKPLSFRQYYYHYRPTWAFHLAAVR